MPVEVVAREGHLFSAAEQNAFVGLVLSGGEVPGHTLRRNIPLAACLVFLHDDGNLHAVAALKIPQASYRNSIRVKSGVTVSDAEFPFELGYIMVVPEARRRGHSAKLVSAALNAAGTRGVFATSREDNAFIHATLEKSGFERAGQSYPSNEDPERRLLLFLRASS